MSATSLSGFLMPWAMLKVSIADEMRSARRMQYICKNRLFNPIKVDCFAAQIYTFETQPNKIYLNHIHLALDSKFKISPNINNYECIPLTRIDIIFGHLWFFSCGSNSQIQNAMHAIPQFHGVSMFLFSFQLLRGIPLVAPYHILLYMGPTCRHGEENRSWLWQCVARNASDPPHYQAPLIHKHTTSKCHIAFTLLTW